MKTEEFYETHIRVSERTKERWEALRRSPRYQQERAEAFQSFQKRLSAEGKGDDDIPDEVMFCASPEGQEVARKYCLVMPFDPKQNFWDTETKYIYAAGGVFLDANIVEVIRQSYVMVPVGGESISEVSEILRNGRYLFLAIDLHKHKQDIMKTFEGVLATFLKTAKGRGPAVAFCLETDSGKLSIFDIWDMNKIQGKSPWKIAQEIFPEVKGTSYQPYGNNYQKETRAIWKKIDAAIKRVDTIISSFNLTS